MKLKFKFKSINENIILGFSGIFFVLIIWFFITNLKLINPIFLSSPQEVTAELVTLFKNGFIISHLIASTVEFILGFSIATILGISLGFIFGWYKRFNKISRPLVYALFTTPTIAIMPLIIIWLGFGIWSKVTIVFLAAFFPILINTTNAIKNIDQDLLKLAKSFNAADLQVFKAIALPYSIPSILSGVRIAIPRGIVGMVVAEFWIGNLGLGYLISFYGSTFQTGRLLAVVMMLIIISISLSLIVDYLERKFKYWKY